MQYSFSRLPRVFPHYLLVSALFLAGTFFIPSFASASAPTGFTGGHYADSDGDGTVDHIIVGINGGEDLTTCNVTSGEVASDWNYVGGSIGGTLGAATCALTGDRAITFTIVGANEGITGGGTAPTIAYMNGDTDNSIANASGNLAGGGPLTLDDLANPVLLQSSISDNEIVGRREDITFLFSEAPVQLDISVYRGGTLLYTIDDASPYISYPDDITLVLNLPSFTGGTYTIQDFAFEDTEAGLSGSALISDPLTFRVLSSDDDTSTPVTSSDSSASLLTPTEGEWIMSGSATNITWSSDAEGASYATLSYSLDNGATWVEIVRNTLNDGEHTWMTPSVEADEVLVKVALTDLADDIATDVSEAFVLSSSADADDSDDTSSEDDATDIDGISAGTFIKTAGSSTIYFVDSSLSRRPFFDAQTFFTYADDFSDVVEVSSETLAKFSMGAPMLPKAGVVLVKIQSVAKVYMVEEALGGSSVLRWVTSEAVAEEMFGSDWSSYVLDVDSTLFTRYTLGDDVDTAFSVDRDMMKMRMHLHE